MESQLLDHVTLAAVVTWLLQWLKNHPKIPLIAQGADAWNRFVAVLFAALASAGIAFDYDASLAVLTISNLTVATGLQFLWACFTQFVLQEGWYRTAIRPGAKEAKGKIEIST